MKTIDLIIVLSAFLFNTLLISPSADSFLIAVGGSLTGSIILVYYRREASKWELILKIFTSAIGGFVLGSVLQEYFHIENESYRLALFVVSSMLALTVLRALLNLTEKNSSEIIKAALQRVLGLRIPGERATRRRVKKLANGRYITLPDNDTNSKD